MTLSERKIFNKVSEAGHLKYEPHMRFCGGGGVTCQFHAHSHKSLTWLVVQKKKCLSGNAVGKRGVRGTFLLLFVFLVFFSFLDLHCLLNFTLCLLCILLVEKLEK